MASSPAPRGPLHRPSHYVSRLLLPSRAHRSWPQFANLALGPVVVEGDLGPEFKVSASSVALFQQLLHANLVLWIATPWLVVRWMVVRPLSAVDAHDELGKRHAARRVNHPEGLVFVAQPDHSMSNGVASDHVVAEEVKRAVVLGEDVPVAVGELGQLPFDAISLERLFDIVGAVKLVSVRC